MIDAWVHIWSSPESLEQMEARVGRLYPHARLRTVLDGQRIATLSEFYEHIERAVPLIRGFGHNLNALIDLFRTFGWGPHAGQQHYFLWYRPDDLLNTSPEDFRGVVDAIVGVSRELVCGEEADPTFDPDSEEDWIPTRLEIILAFGESEAADSAADSAKRLSEDWQDEFSSLEVPVERIDISP